MVDGRGGGREVRGRMVDGRGGGAETKTVKAMIIGGTMTVVEGKGMNIPETNIMMEEETKIVTAMREREERGQITDHSNITGTCIISALFLNVALELFYPVKL